MKNTTTKNLIAIGALALMLVVTNTASAYVPGVWDPQVRPVNPNPSFTNVVSSYSPVDNQTTTSTTTNINPKTQVTTIPDTTKTVSTKTTTTRNTTVARSNTNTNTNVTNRDVNYVNTNQGAIQGSLYPNNNGSELTALSINGSGSFMPSSIWQWLLVIFLILVIIIIARMLGRSPEHHHEVHTVTAH